jgi:hypothetical protein
MSQFLLRFVSAIPLIVFTLHADARLEAVRASPDGRYTLKVSVESDGSSALHTVHRNLYFRNALILSHTTRGVEDDTFGQNELLTSNRLSFTLHARSLDWRRGFRTAEFHYRLVGAAAQRIGPLARNAADFVEEWIAAPWTVARQYAGNVRVLHKRMKTYARATIDVAHRLRAKVWEVVVRFARNFTVAFRVTQRALTAVRVIRR